MKDIILIGKPCSGKGTLAKLLLNEKYAHISGSNVLRENSTTESAPYYKEATHALKTGELISSHIMNGMMKSKIESLKDNHIVFDGFPRSVSQAELLLSLRSDLNNIVVLYLNMPDSAIIKRVSNRLCCKVCGDSYNKTTLQPKIDGVCDSCGGEVSQRVDDNAETLKTRLSQYTKKTEPVIDFLRDKVTIHTLTEDMQTLDFILPIVQ